LPSACPGFAAVIPALPDPAPVWPVGEDCVLAPRSCCFFSPGRTRHAKLQDQQACQRRYRQSTSWFHCSDKAPCRLLSVFQPLRLPVSNLPSRQFRDKTWEVLSTNVVIMNFVKKSLIPALLRVSYPQPGRPIGPQDRCPHGATHKSRLACLSNHTNLHKLGIETARSAHSVRFSPGYPEAVSRRSAVPEIFHSASTRLPELRVSTEFCELFP